MKKDILYWNDIFVPESELKIIKKIGFMEKKNLMNSKECCKSEMLGKWKWCERLVSTKDKTAFVY